MLELPEAATAAKQLNGAAAGRAVRLARANASPHRFAFYTGGPEEYSAKLEGRVIDGASFAGGQVEISLGELRLVLNDGASPRYFAPGEPRPEKHQLLLELDDGAALACTVRMYGGIHLFREGESGNFYYLAAREKPSPLSEAFDARYFASLREGLKPTVSAKAFLATEQRIPGLGNGVLQDVLFRAGVHPKRRLDSLSEEAFAALFGSVKETLAQMAEQGGRDVEKDLYGRPGGYRTLLSAKTAAGPCPRCGGGLVRQAYLGGNVYFCPRCQPLE